MKQLNPYAIIEVSCPKCERILFRGTRREAKSLIIYCVDCSKH